MDRERKKERETEEKTKPNYFKVKRETRNRKLTHT